MGSAGPAQAWSESTSCRRQQLSWEGRCLVKGVCACHAPDWGREKSGAKARIRRKHMVSEELKEDQAARKQKARGIVVRFRKVKLK